MTIHLMPSEISRLVLGYLRETNCKETEKVFIKESKHLTEYANGLRHGINYSTNINGKSLMDVINSFYCHQNQENNTNNGKLIQNKSNEELQRMSKQLTRVETILNKLSQNMNSNNVKTNNCQNNYRLIASSPPIISTSSPLFINTIGLNPSPIVCNETPEKSSKTLVPNTPSSVGVSPRRKRTPRRLLTDGSTPLRHLVNSTFDDSSNQSIVNTSSDQLRDETEPQLRIDINEPLVQPEFIVEELLNFEPLHDVLANNINKIFGSVNQNCGQINQNVNQIQDITNENNKQNHQNIDPQEIHLNDEDVNHILANLESAPEFTTILDKITEKELQMTPFKNLPSVESNTSSASSLNTPKTPQILVNAQKISENSTSVVKNLMTDLRTPEKTITLYAGRSPSDRTRITPVKVTPVKVFRTDMNSDFNFVLNDNNLPIIVPKVSVVGEDYNLIQNTIANQSKAYTMSVQTHPNPTPAQYYNSSGIRRPIGKKRIDFSKMSYDIQTTRPDLMPRKILPKPSSNTSMTTSITQVCAVSTSDVQTVPKQSLILVNSNSNGFESNANNVTESESELQKRLQTKDKNKKRLNTETDDSSPIKIRASDVHFPTVNILRKMNVNSMNQFLNQIHAKPNSK